MLLVSSSLRKKVVSVALLVAFSSGCTSTTLINTRPTGARVEVDGRYIGDAPASYSETVTAWTRNQVRLTLAGYKQNIGFISADNWVGSKVAGSVILGLTCLPLIGFIGLIWSTEYRPSYDFLLEPEVGTVPGYGVPVQGGGGYQTAPMAPPQPSYQPQGGTFGPGPQQPANQQMQPQPMGPQGGFERQPAPMPSSPTPPPPPPPLRKYDPDGLRH